MVASINFHNPLFCCQFQYASREFNLATLLRTKLYNCSTGCFFQVDANATVLKGGFLSSWLTGLKALGGGFKVIYF